MSPQGRRAFVERENKQRERKLSTTQKQDIASVVKLVRRTHDLKLDTARKQFLKDCAALKKSQAEERAMQRQKWQDYNRDRRVLHAKSKSRGVDRSRYQDMERQAAEKFGRGL